MSGSSTSETSGNVAKPAGLEKFTGGNSVGVDVQAIERDLAALWRQASSGDEGNSVTRACLWNLISYADGFVSFADVRKKIDDMVLAVPARSIIVHPINDEKLPEIQAFISANCHIAPGGGKLLCSEEITIEPQGRGHEHVPALLRSLLVPDLPTALLWFSALPKSVKDVAILAEGADRVVVDTTSFAPALYASNGRVWSNLMEFAALPVVDIAWLRAAPVRLMCASLFDTPDARKALQNVARLRIEVQAGQQHAATLLVGWISVAMNWGKIRRVQSRSGDVWFIERNAGNATVQVEIATSTTAGHQSGIVAVEIHDTKGNHFVVSGGADRQFSVERTVDGQTTQQSVTVANHSETEMLIAALGARGRDLLYRRALRAAAALEVA